MSRRIVPYELEEGLLLVDDEAWRPDELVDCVLICRACGLRYVTFTGSGTPVAGARRRYCSTSCSKAAKARRSRERVWPSSRRKAA